MVFLTGIYTLNILALSAMIYIVIYNLLFRKCLSEVIIEIDAIDHEVIDFYF